MSFQHFFLCTFNVMKYHHEFLLLWNFLPASLPLGYCHPFNFGYTVPTPALYLSGYFCLKWLLHYIPMFFFPFYLNLLSLRLSCFPYMFLILVFAYALTCLEFLLPYFYILQYKSFGVTPDIFLGWVHFLCSHSTLVIFQ